MFGVFAIDEFIRYRWTQFAGSRTLCHPAMNKIFILNPRLQKAVISVKSRKPRVKPAQRKHLSSTCEYLFEIMERACNSQCFHRRQRRGHQCLPGHQRSVRDIVKNEHFDETPRCSHEALRPLAQAVDLHQEGRPLLEQDNHPSSKTWFLHLPQTRMLLRIERRPPPASERMPCYLQ